MYLGAGATIEGKLGEAISSANVDVQTVAVDTSNNVSVKTSQQLDGVTARTIVDANKGFVDEIIIKNTDSTTHSITIQINDGVNTRVLVTTPVAQGSSLTYKPGVGWQVLGAYIGSGWITSGMLANGVVLSGSIGSGQIGGPHIASGGIGSGDLADGSVTSAAIGSGQVSSPHLASGSKIDSAEWLVSDNVLTAERVSGVRAVAISTSGTLVVAMAGQSGRFPAVGVVVDNVESGQAASRYHKGRVFASMNLSGARGGSFPVWLGTSGELVTSSPLPGGSGLSQVMGYAVTNSGMTVEMSYVLSGMIGRYALASGSIMSGHIASGQIPSQAFASGSVSSGAIASGSVSTMKIASGVTVTYARAVVADSPVLNLVTEETISGFRAVNISQSGYARVAMAGVSGRMPAVGMLLGNVASGLALSSLSGTPIVVQGRIVPTSGTLPTSGFGLFLYVGMSGNIVGPAGITSGMVVQRLGINASSGQMLVSVCDRITSGLETTFKGNF